jgi:hypothetical protein
MESGVTGRIKKYSLEFQQAAVERMKSCGNVAALARDLHVRRKWLYEWRTKLDPEWADRGRGVEASPPVEASEHWRKVQELQEESKRLKQLAGQQAMDLHFFKTALREIERQRRASKKLGAAPSTRPSEA